MIRLPTQIALFLTLLSIISALHAHQVSLPDDIEWDPAHATNYKAADRVSEGLIKYIFIHDTQESYLDTLEIFQCPNSVAAHYVINNHLSIWEEDKTVRPDGHITRMVNDSDIGYHVKGANDHSIGIEHVGFINPSTLRVVGGFSWRMYRRSAHLTAWLCQQYAVPLDRDHILGHAECKKVNCTSNHSDPGLDWDWNLYMTMVREFAYGDGCRYPQLVEDGWTVRVAQMLLNMSRTDGVLTQETMDVIRAYQQTKGIQEESMGRATWRSLISDAMGGTTVSRWDEAAMFLLQKRFYIDVTNSNLTEAIAVLQHQFDLLDGEQTNVFMLAGCHFSETTGGQSWWRTATGILLISLAVCGALSLLLVVVVSAVVAFLVLRAGKRTPGARMRGAHALLKEFDEETPLDQNPVV